MKKFTKILAIVLAVSLLALSLVACNKAPVAD